MAAIVIVVVVEQQGVLCYALLEVAEILLCRRCPACLGNGGEAWQGKVLEQVGVLHVLGPECTLYTNIVFVQVRRYACGYGCIVVHRLYVVCSVACYRWFVGIGTLFAVNVVWYLCGYDRLHAILCRLQRTWLCIANLPAHHCAACSHNLLLICSACSEALVPHYHGALLVALLCCHVVRYLAHEVRLQLSVVGESHLLHQGLALGIVLPGVCGCLVATDVNLAVREHLYNFIEHVLCKLQHQWACNVEYIAEDASANLHAVACIGVAAELGVCRVHCA